MYYAENMSVAPACKRPRLALKPANGSFRTGPTLELLSNDVLLIIFSYLPKSSLLAISQLGPRWRDLCAAKSLWTSIDDDQPQTLSSLHKILHLGSTHLDKIEKIRILGFQNEVPRRIVGTFQSDKNRLRPIQNVSQSLLTMLREKCSSLETLTLEGVYMNVERVPFTCFPRKLRKLSLRDSTLENIPFRGSVTWFQSIATHMPHLEVFDLTNCSWVLSSFLLSIAKLPELKVLKLRGCFRVGKHPSYLALAPMMGFHKLEVLDISQTRIEPSEIVHWLRKSECLHTLYMERTPSCVSDELFLSQLTVFKSTSLPTLRRLYIAGNNLSREAVEAVIVNMPLLERLDVGDCSDPYNLPENPNG
ncbi:unnamed protein product [Cyprideis torosa]|uniref:Uncharacterized protein n=1 Tax=Cyprideis torosa TaxID=163714 RepID=A0A7R8W3Y1_9CRUS|nr:unnamed protein product [Cyprideis torosa]CAG0882603.1 unnamed protein product [Cyprideis torosa]